MTLLTFLIRRLLAIPITLFIITLALYGIIMLAPVEERAMLYWPPRTRNELPPELFASRVEQIIEEHGLRDSLPRQYLRWVSGLLQGDWGWSPVLQDDVLPVLLRRTPVTAELTLYSLLLFIPLGLLNGVVAGWRPGSHTDNALRLTAFVGASIPPFILGLTLLSVFYVGLRWFPPGRTGIVEISLTTVTSFKTVTGLLTIDGLLNGRLDVTLDALRHLVLPVLTLSVTHWATLMRVTRVAIMEEKQKDYVVAAYARGLLPASIVWRHTFRNVLSPALTSTTLSAALLIMGVFIVEAIFNFKGLSELITRSVLDAPDAPLALGFGVYAVLLVLPLMFVLDVLKVVVDPRLLTESDG